MLPHMFEKMSMQDLRTLIAERSIMNIYISGECFELLPQSVGFLLEGFVKIQGGQQELLTAPAAILPRLDQSSSHSETLGTLLFPDQICMFLIDAYIRATISSFDLSLMLLF